MAYQGKRLLKKPQRNKAYRLRTLGLICVLLALLLWWFASVRRFHDVNLSGWWFLLALLFPPVITLGLCLWPGTPDYNRFGAPSR